MTNFLVVVADQLRADAVGATARTPHLERLAVGGAVFTNAYAQHPVCAPSRAPLVRDAAACRTSRTSSARSGRTATT